MTMQLSTFSAPVIRPASTAAAALTFVALVTLPVRDDLYLAFAGMTFDSSILRALAGAVASRGLLLLVALAALVAVWSWLRDRAAFWGLASAGIGVIGAYLLSEMIKLMVTEHRPCHVMEVDIVVPCPEMGDWSWPSNHSVIAAAFAVACILALPRTAWFAVPVAGLIAYSRVAVGVHYVHDAASGLALGTAAVILVVVALQPVVNRLTKASVTSSTVVRRRY